MHFSFMAMYFNNSSSWSNMFSIIYMSNKVLNVITNEFFDDFTYPKDKELVDRPFRFSE